MFLVGLIATSPLATTTTTPLEEHLISVYAYSTSEVVEDTDSDIGSHVTAESVLLYTVVFPRT
jgi:hypothetical protein